MISEKTTKSDELKYLNRAIVFNDMANLYAFLASTADINAATNSERQTPLMHMASHGRTEMVRLLYDRGADLDLKDTYGRTALHFAVGLNHARIALLLLDLGADATAVKIDDTVLLHAAIKSRHFATVKAFLDRGADPDSYDKEGSNALSKAVSPEWNGWESAPDERIVHLLLKQGADINGGFQSGSSALMHLALLSMTEHVKIVSMVKLLLALGADVNATSLKGITALSFAYLARNIVLQGEEKQKVVLADTVIELLRRAGATEHGIEIEIPEPYIPILNPI